MPPFAHPMRTVRAWAIVCDSKSAVNIQRKNWSWRVIERSSSSVLGCISFLVPSGGLVADILGFDDAAYVAIRLFNQVGALSPRFPKQGGRLTMFTLSRTPSACVLLLPTPQLHLRAPPHMFPITSAAPISSSRSGGSQPSAWPADAWTMDHACSQPAR